jgi:hypothetical protein
MLPSKILTFKTHADRAMPPHTPQRRRVIIIGAGATGLSVAYFLGEHSLLLDKRDSIDSSNHREGDSHDHPGNLSLGIGGAGYLGSQDSGSGGERSRTSQAERKDLYAAFTASAGALTSTDELIRVKRWNPPPLQVRTPETVTCADPSCRALLPLLAGEVRWSAEVAHVFPSQHRIELGSGDSFVYDKLVTTVPLAELLFMLAGEVPRRIRSDDTLRYWLNARDVEVVDRATQAYYGDENEFSAAKRISDNVRQALSTKFLTPPRSFHTRTGRLFEPRLVPGTLSVAP